VRIWELLGFLHGFPGESRSAAEARTRWIVARNTNWESLDELKCIFRRMQVKPGKVVLRIDNQGGVTKAFRAAIVAPDGSLFQSIKSA